MDKFEDVSIYFCKNECTNEQKQSDDFELSFSNYPPLPLNDSQNLIDHFSNETQNMYFNTKIITLTFMIQYRFH